MSGEQGFPPGSRPAFGLAQVDSMLHARFLGPRWMTAMTCEDAGFRRLLALVLVPKPLWSKVRSSDGPTAASHRAADRGGRPVHGEHGLDHHRHLAAGDRH